MISKRKTKKLNIRINAEVLKAIEDNIGTGTKSTYLRMLIKKDLKRCNLLKDSMEDGADEIN